jgi:hypothetical protein
MENFSVIVATLNPRNNSLIVIQKSPSNLGSP